jgi:hypothetical protein
MRKILHIIVLSFITNVNIVWAQSPNKMSYQAVIRNTSGALLVSSPVGMRISIMRGSVTGTPVFIETHLDTTNINGLLTLEIGTGSLVSGSLSSIDWGNGSYFLKTETDPSGGTSYSISGTSQLLSVPYALYAQSSAKTSDSSLWSINGNTRIHDSSFIGTRDTFDLKFRVNNVNAGFVNFKNRNTAFGYNSLKSPKSGYSNISIGVNNLNVDSSGFENIGIGNYTLNSLTTGWDNIAIGDNSQSNSSHAVHNVSMGINTLRYNTNGNSMVAIGVNALANFDFPVSIAAYNTAIGEGSMGRATTGYRNTGIGAYSFHFLTSGQQNTAVGIDAGQNLKTGSYNVFLGNGTNVTDSSISNSIAIGWNAVVSNSNVLLLGDTSNTNLNVGIGTANPKRKLHIKSVMRLEPINTAPSSPNKGDIYFDGILNKLRVYDGTTWQNCW